MNDAPSIHIEDIKKYLFQKKHLFWGICLCFFLLIFSFSLLKQVRYQAVATFKEGEVKTESSSTSLLKKFFHETQASLGTQAQMLMLSQKLLFETIQKLSLQAEIREKTLFQMIQKRIKDQFRLMKKKYPDERFYPIVREVHYLGEKEKSFFLKVLDNKELKITSAKTGDERTFLPGKQVHIEDVSFIIDLPQGFHRLGSSFSMKILPLETAYEKVRKNLAIKVKKEEPKLLDLSFKHTNRHLAAHFLNEHMQTYKEYLKKDYELISQEQIKFLEERQKDIAKNLEQSLADYSNYIKDEYGEEGFLNLAQQITVFEDQKKDYRDQLFQFDIKLSQLKSQKGYVSEESSQQLQSKMDELQKRKKALQLYYFSHYGKKSHIAPLKTSLDISTLNSLNFLKNQSEQNFIASKVKSLPIFERFQNALTHLHHRQKALMLEKKTKDFLGCLDEKVLALKELEELKLEAKRTLSDYEKNHLQKVFFPERAPALEGHIQRALLKRFLVDLVDVITLKEALYKESFSQGHFPHEIEGMDLSSVDKMYFQTLSSLDATRLETRQLQLALDKMQHRDFEVSSLSSLHPSVIYQDMVMQISQLYHQLRDEPNLMTKDKERLHRQIGREKERLKRHLLYQKSLLQIQEKMQQEKIALAKQMQLELVNQEIALLKQQRDKLIAAKVHQLNQEKSYVTQKLNQMADMMKNMPKRWYMENKLQLATEMNLSIMEGISHLVESKNIDHKLLHIESKPIDLARVPSKPENHPIWLISSLGSLFSGFLALSFLLMKQIQRGLPLSLEGIKSYQIKAFGPLSPKERDFFSLPSQDLTVIRYIAQFILEKKCSRIGFLLNEQRNYVKALAHLLALSDKKVLLIETFPREKSPKGLMQYLLGKDKEPHILREKKFDQLSLGGYTDFTSELLCREKFHLFLEQSAKKYDCVFLLAQDKLSTPLPLILLTYVEQLIVTLNNESLQELHPFLDWAKPNTQKNIAFLSVKK